MLDVPFVVTDELFVLTYFRWTFNPAVLTKVHGSISSTHSPSGAAGGLNSSGAAGDSSSQVFAIGDMVQILNEVERVKQLQRGERRHDGCDR